MTNDTPRDPPLPADPLGGTEDRGKIGAVLVDDEDLARRVLRQHLSRHPDIEILAECSNGFEAVKCVTELQPDLLFLDVQMPKLDGFEVLELIGHEIAVVFVTAYDEFALRAFEVRALDYLLKPFRPERLDEAVLRARQRIGTPPAAAFDDLVAQSRKRRAPHDRVLVRTGSRVHVLPVARIDYVESQDDYVCFKCAGKEFLKLQSMNELEELLDPARFIRIHRSYLINIERLARLEMLAKDSRIAILSDGTRLPVSRAGYARLKPLL
jgi:two-component system LytT family response regulator